MEARVIIAQSQKSNKSNHMVWKVGITGESFPRAYCKSAYKAMRYCFLLKKKVGVNISENCLARLSQEVAQVKIENQKVEFIEKQEQRLDNEIEKVAQEQRQEMKKQRKSRKGQAKVVSLQ